MSKIDVDFRKFDSSLGIEYSKFASHELGRDMWVVKAAFNLQLSDERRINVPKGYLTAGASVPRLFWGLIPPWGEYGQAAVMYDWLCEYLVIWDDNHKDWISIDRSDCDALFNTGMHILGVNKTKRLVMYNAVRLYGHVASVAGRTYDPVKGEIEKYLLQNYNATGNWI